MAIVGTTEQFILDARKLHGDRYDYSRVQYKNSYTKVEIICRTHGSFWKTPIGHLRGCGCNSCPVEEPAFRACSQCGTEKPIDSFHFRGKHRVHVCKECTRGHAEFKVCSKCHEEKNVSEFGKTEDSRDGYKYYCNECRRLDRLVKKEEINARRRSVWRQNPEEERKKAREYYQKNHDKMRKKANAYCERNRERILAKERKYKKENADRIRANYREYVRNRRAIDPNFKLRGNLRNRIKDVLARGRYKKCAHTMELLGCSVEFFKKHLESKFASGMSWENYGSGWHIDHIMPCASFDLSKPAEQRKCFHYTNLQPLWAEENMKKRAKILQQKVA
jgi:hypothetical protein